MNERRKNFTTSLKKKIATGELIAIAGLVGFDAGYNKREKK